MIKDLEAWAEIRGYKIAWGSVSVLEDVKKEFDALRTAGELDETFYQEYLNWFKYPHDVSLPEPKSVIVVAVPRPAHRLTFALMNDQLDTVLPPTYVAYKGTTARVCQDVISSLFQGPHRAEVLQAPLKAVAARLGLVSYGRNNITYIPGVGSFFQLAGVITDAELPSPPGGYPQRAASCPECESCRICFRACPTGAIDEKRFLLRAERCFVLCSENPGPWPEWLIPSLRRCFSAHSCLVGCLICQMVCPLDTGLLRLEDAEVSFSAEETERILAGYSGESDPEVDGIKAKLKGLGLNDQHYPCLGRNLRELLRISQTSGF